MTPEIKRMIPEKAKIYRRYVKHDRSFADYQSTSRCKRAIKETKSDYFSRLGQSQNDPTITPKKYWTILHSFLHKHKIPKIPPIRHINTFLTDTLVKANTFNSFFAKQRFLIETGSELLADYLLTHHHLESINVDWAKFLLSVLLMLAKLMGGTTCLCVWSKFVMNLWLYLFLLFSLETGNFPSNWKRSNIVLVQKK